MEIGYTNYTNLDACFSRPYECGDRLVRGYSGTIVTDRGERIEAIAERSSQSNLAGPADHPRRRAVGLLDCSRRAGGASHRRYVSRATRRTAASAMTAGIQWLYGSKRL